ncbi:protein of unknown function DUF1007 [Methylobacterium sp. 4-46]|uniref:DUF1007 family protein n=1 Tax=unclassified Methylobacterium TaxID=2615210 RepID=UPI000165C69B|nr:MULTISPECIES: DUF1007 family protein [Methylobacterium]ACA16791.1 protein of unknown function DUF1007 [Methylobacterium sp. 4-46]WFT82486.1 DUF1007 family protein [Methylobacterium nodulans]
MPLSRLARLTLSLGALLAAGGAAQAHPHVWITTRAEVVYGPDGRVAAIRHAWTFDPSYSAFAVQGLGGEAPSPDGLAALARENTENLAESAYFTSLKIDGRKQEFDGPQAAAMTFAEGRLTLRFTLPLRTPAKGPISLDVYDPTYFVAFSLAEGEDAATLVGAPASCKALAHRPKSAAPAQMSESFFSALTDAANYGVQFANRITVTCS